MSSSSSSTCVSNTKLYVKRLSANAILPRSATTHAAGYDLYSSHATELIVPARGRLLIPTDLSICFPYGTYGRIAPRSGLAYKNGIDVGGGVIDFDYRGAVGILLFNHSDVNFSVNYGDRVAQLICEKIETIVVEEVLDLNTTERGTNGFGSTGVSKLPE